MRLLSLAVCAVVAAGTLTVHAATLTGDTIQSQFAATGYTPSPYAGPVSTVAPGTTGAYPGIASAGTFSIAYTATTITLLSAGGTTSFASGFTFNGAEFNVLTGTPFATVSIDPSTTLAGFTSGDLSLSAGTIAANLGGLVFGSNQSLVLDVTTVAATPEPSSLVLLGTGLVALGRMCTQKRRSKQTEEIA